MLASCVCVYLYVWITSARYVVCVCVCVHVIMRIHTHTHNISIHMQMHLPFSLLHAFHMYTHTNTSIPVYTRTQTHQTGAGAVNSVDQYFQQTAEGAPHRWVPGDTQKISALPPLGTTTTNGWTSNPLIYGQQEPDRKQKCQVYCPSCSTDSMGW